MRPFRFGAAVGYAENAAEWREQAKRIEGLGYSTLLIADHFVNPFAPLPALQASADATSTLRVGTMVIDNDFRHPAMLAKEVATIDLLTDGRFELGIGAGWLRMEYEAAGLPFDPAPTRIDRLEEGIAILKGLWGEEPFSFDGAFYKITDLQGMPPPVQQPYPPLMIGGGGKRMLGLAAREADIVNLAPMVRDTGVDYDSLTAAGIEQRVAWVHEAAGARFGDLELGTYYSGRSEITDDRASAVEAKLTGFEQRTGTKPTLTPEDVLASPMFLMGTVGEVKDRIVENRERYGLSYIVLSDDMIEGCASIVAELAGT